MPQHQSKFSRFWQELKRRRVIHVITVYASAAFVIIELAGNLTEPLNLPTSLSTIVIIVLVVGFLPAVILSWIYDLTAGTLKRTKPEDELQDEEKVQVSGAWKVATIISFIVIVGLVVFNIVDRGDVLKPGMVQSLAILPFDNFTGDDQLDYVAAGLHSSLITDMGRLSALRVTGRTSSSIYQGANKSAPQIAKELKVDALVEPAVLCYGDSVCLQIRVITTYPRERQLFVEEYKVDKSQVLNLYSTIAKQIADEIMIEISPEEKQFLAKSRTVDKEAYDAFLQSHMYWDDLTKEGLEKAIDFLNIALEKDPTWAPAYSGLAIVWLSMAQVAYTSPEVAGPKIFENLQKAIELDPNLPDLHYTMAMIAYLNEWDWEKAEKEFLQALAINPNDPFSRVFYAHLLMILQRYEEALSQSQRAIELDPLNPQVLMLDAAVMQFTGNFRAALQQYERTLELDPGNYFVYTSLDIMAFYCEEYDKAIESLQILMPFEDELKKRIQDTYDQEGIRPAYELILQELEKMNQEGLFALTPLDMSSRYIMLGEYGKAVEWIVRGYEIHDPNEPYINSDLLMVDEIVTDPRVVDILKKMNLPLPESD